MSFNVQHLRSSELNKRPLANNMLEGELVINFNAGSPGLFFKDNAGAVVKIGPAHYGEDAPNSSPANGGSIGNSIGEFWYDSANGVLKIFNGTGWENLEAGLIQSISGTGAISVDDSDPANPVISVDSASTSVAGVVQLNDTRTSTSTTQALTANQGRVLQEQIDALTTANNLTLAGTLDASTGLVDSVTSAGTAAGFSVGFAVPNAASSNTDHFVIVDVRGSNGPAGVGPFHIGDWFLSSGTAWQALDVGFQASDATTSAAGVVELATDAETAAGVDSSKAVTPAGLQSKVSDSVSTTSSTTIASSTAVKAAYDKGVAAEVAAQAAQDDATSAYNTAFGAEQLANAAQVSATTALANAATAQTAANSAQADATEALTDAAAAQTTANTALTAAAAAQSTANSAATAASNAGFAAASAANAASAAQGDATQALNDAAAAQTTANQALNGASAAQTDASQALINAAAAQADATEALSQAATNSTDIAQAQADATQALADAASALAAAQDAAAGAIPETTIQAKGDLIVGTGNETYTNVSVGSPGFVLVADPTEAAGVRWVSADAGTF